MNFNDFIDDQLNDEKYREPENLVVKSTNNYIKNIEAEYTGYDSAVVSRKKEIKEINDKMIALKRELNSIKPQKGLSGSVKKRSQNSELLTKKRDKLRREIAELKFKLEEITMEGGEDASSKDVLGGMLKKDKKGNHIIEIHDGKPVTTKPAKKSELLPEINLISNPYLDI